MKAKISIFVLSLFACQTFAMRNISEVKGMQIRDDGSYDVICTDGSREIASPLDIRIGNICPNRPIVANANIISLQKRQDGQFNILCRDGSSVTASADDIVAGKPCSPPAYGAPVDMIWIVGGMTEQQANFKSGVTQFMTDFLQRSSSWRMAVVGDNTQQGPFLGIPNVFDNTSANPLQTFVDQVIQALNGYDQELIFDPLVATLSQNRNFIRPNAKLVVVLTNDAPDASKQYVKATQVLQFLTSLKGGRTQDITVYGIFGASDLNCKPDQIDANWNYNGSEFYALINATGGKVYSLCNASFGASLMNMSSELSARLKP